MQNTPKINFVPIDPAFMDTVGNPKPVLLSYKFEEAIDPYRPLVNIVALHRNPDCFAKDYPAGLNNSDEDARGNFVLRSGIVYKPMVFCNASASVSKQYFVCVLWLPEIRLVRPGRSSGRGCGSKKDAVIEKNHVVDVLRNRKALLKAACDWVLNDYEQKRPVASHIIVDCVPGAEWERKGLREVEAVKRKYEGRNDISQKSIERRISEEIADWKADGQFLETWNDCKHDFVFDEKTGQYDDYDNIPFKDMNVPDEMDFEGDVFVGLGRIIV